MNDRSHHAPLYEALLAYRESGNRSYHVPGHKNGQAYRRMPTKMKGEGARVEDAIPSGAAVSSEFVGRKTVKGEMDHYILRSFSTPDMAFMDMMRMDVTEITGTDDLHHPEGVILEAQQLAADCYGAEESFFLVGGSTVGNLSLLLTICNEPGSVVLVQRNVHKSVIHGLMLAGAKAVFLEPWVDAASGLAVLPSVETVQAAVQAYPEAKGVLVTSPNYYGMGSDLTPFAEVCHAAGMPLLVDEAHGAHYGQHPRLPKSALSCGADGVVQSTHKMLSAFTMGAMLHVQGPRINRSLLRQRLAMVQSSSPSYPLMASLDLARRHLHVHGAEAFTAGLAAVEAFRRGLAEMPRFRLLQPAQPCAAGYTAQDPFKAVIHDGAGVLSGYRLQQQLEARGCVPEMSDERYVVLLFSLGSTMQDAEHLLQALDEIDQANHPGHVELELLPQPDLGVGMTYISTWNNFENAKPFSDPVPFSLQPVLEGDISSVSIEESVGHIASEMITPYPPGIPLVYPGERITSAMAARLKLLSQEGAKFHGAYDPRLQTLKIKKDGVH